MRVILITYCLLSFCFSLTGQSIKAEFCIKAQIDNGWFLRLKKNHTYKYVHFSGFSNGSGTLDSGNYVIDKDTISFISCKNINKDLFTSKQYLIKKLKLNRYQRIVNSIKIYRKSIFGISAIVLLNKNDSIRTYSLKPDDNINIYNLAPDSSLKQWICNNRLRIFNYLPTEIDSSNWTDLFSSDKLEVKAIHNGRDMFDIYFLSNNKIYCTIFPRVVNYYKPITDKFLHENIINSKEKKELINRIKTLIKKQT